jgi:mannose-6-phosphate isomerase
MKRAPHELRATLRRRPWGGGRLAELWPVGTAEREEGAGPFGEAWLAGPESGIAAGPAAGATLAALTARHGPDLVGTVPFARYGARFPLLVKLLDAAEPLSLQVHPDDAYALREEAASGHLGKTEAWWVLEAAQGAQVWWGFRRHTDRREVEAAVAAGALAELLRVLPVAAGDVVVNPAGTVHALGAGLTVYEVQQASDLTYRLDDHGRLGADGRPRTLHVERALDVADWAPGAAPAPQPQGAGRGRSELARTEAFALERIAPLGRDGAAWTVGGGSFDLLTHLPTGDDPGRAGRLVWTEGEVDVRPGASWLLPAGLGDVRLEGGGPYARTWVPAPAGGPDAR